MIKTEPKEAPPEKRPLVKTEPKEVPPEKRPTELQTAVPQHPVKVELQQMEPVSVGNVEKHPPSNIPLKGLPRIPKKVGVVRAPVQESVKRPMVHETNRGRGRGRGVAPFVRGPGHLDASPRMVKRHVIEESQTGFVGDEARKKVKRIPEHG